MGDKDSKTEKATPKKRKDERKKGNVFIAKDLISVATLFTSAMLLRVLFPDTVRRLGAFIRYCYGLLLRENLEEIPSEMIFSAITVVARSSGIMLLASCVVSTAITMFQTRLLVTTEPLKPKLSKLNPISGFKKLFSMRSVVDLLKNLVKITIMIFVIFTCIRDQMNLSVRYLYADLFGACTHLLGQIFSMMMKVGLAFLVVGVADTLYQHWQFEKDLRMSKEEIKEEFKQIEGDPKVKAKIKEIQRKQAMARMMQQVPKADVIIRNPTHVAVALRYRADEAEAPVVLAMGLDSLALRIVAVAEENDITVIENVPLARALYAQSELNRPIPTDLYEAVAEVMVYLYKLGKLKT